MIDLVLKFRVDRFDYVVYATSDTVLKCFSCGNIAHAVRNCPRKNVNAVKQSILAVSNLVESSTVVPTASRSLQLSQINPKPTVGLTHTRRLVILALAWLETIYFFKHHFSLLRIYHFSDHCAVCNVFIKAFKPTSAYWCFNKSLLDDKHFKDTFTFFCEGFRQENYSGIMLKLK